MLVLMEQNAEMKEQLTIHTQMLQEILKRQRGMENLKAARLPENLHSSVPIKSKENLEQVEQHLGNGETYKQMISSFVILYTLIKLRHLYCVMWKFYSIGTFLEEYKQ